MKGNSSSGDQVWELGTWVVIWDLEMSVTSLCFLLGTVPRSKFWAKPGSEVPLGSSVTLWCKGILEAEMFYLLKTGDSSSWHTLFPLEPGDKANFSVPYITEAHLGTYQCCYHSPAGSSELSDPLELIVSGEKQLGPEAALRNWCLATEEVGVSL